MVVLDQVLPPRDDSVRTEAARGETGGEVGNETGAGMVMLDQVMPPTEK